MLVLGFKASNRGKGCMGGMERTWKFLVLLRVYI